MFFRFPYLNLVCLYLCCLLFVCNVLAQDAVSPAKNDDVVVRERTLYVPFEKLKGAFEGEGKGVFLPYDEFRKLWDAAHPAAEPVKPDAPPVKVAIVETDSSAKVVGDLVEVEAVVRFEILATGWHQLPLRLNGAAIIDASIDGKPARILGGLQDENGYRLLVERKKGEATNGELKLRYACSIVKTPGRNAVSFAVPQAPVSRWEMVVAESGVKIDFEPMIAASEVPQTDTAKKETRYRAFVGSASTVQIAWTPKSEGATNQETLASANLLQQVTLDDGVVRSRVGVEYSIRRSQMEKLSIEIPADQKVVALVNDNVRKWTVEKPSDNNNNNGNADGETGKQNTQIINIELFEPAKTQQNLTLELERFLDSSGERASVTIPCVKPLGISGFQGTIGLVASQELVCEVKRNSGLLQIDPNELPNGLKNDKTTFAFRMAAVNYELELTYEKVKPLISATPLVNVTITQSNLTLEIAAVYNIEKAGVFQFQMNVPDGFNVTRITPITTQAIRPVQVEGHQLSESKLPPTANETKWKLLTVNLSRQAIGKIGFVIHLSKNLNDENLRRPTDKSVDFTIPVPRLDVDGIERVEGLLQFHADKAFRITPLTANGLQTVPADQPQPTFDAIPKRGGAMLSYVFGREPAELAVQVLRRTPQVTIRQLLAVQVDDGVARFTDTINYEVLYSGVKSLRIDVPKTISSQLRNRTAEVRDTIMQPQPDDVADDYEAWNFAREGELINNGSFQLQWETPLAQLQDGKSVTITIPRFVPHGVFRSWGQILLAKAETVDIGASDETLQGLRQIDPQHDVNEGERLVNAAFGFEFHDEWKLEVTATRYEPQDVKRVSIERGLLRSVVTRSGAVSVQALFRIRSVKQRLVFVLPKGAALDTDPRIDGRPATLETDAAGHFLVPLVETKPDTPFLLEIRYTQKPEQATVTRGIKFVERFPIPQFPDEPAVQHLYIAAYLPNEYSLLNYGGQWSRAFLNDYESSVLHLAAAGGAVYNNPTDNELFQELSNGVAMSEFSIDGNAYVFSAVQPSPTIADELKITAAKTSALRFVFALPVIAIALLLIRSTWTKRVVVALIVAVCFVVSALFIPTLSVIALPSVIPVTFCAIAAWIAISLLKTGSQLRSNFVKYWTRKKEAKLVEAVNEAPAE
ncbi:MAG: hypothetical protein LBU65_08570 [Planctomycetaceae bacterium]|nr:hypothetical protein [Planctomycetaceae bacterium]